MGRRATKTARQKGKEFERKTAAILAKWYGKEVRRVPTSGAWDPKRFPGDLYSDATFPFCVECKKNEAWNERLFFSKTGSFLVPWWKQCLTSTLSCERQLFPILVFSRDFSPVYSYLELDPEFPDVFSDIRLPDTVLLLESFGPTLRIVTLFEDFLKLNCVKTIVDYSEWFWEQGGWELPSKKEE